MKCQVVLKGSGDGSNSWESPSAARYAASEPAEGEYMPFVPDTADQMDSQKFNCMPEGEEACCEAANFLSDTVDNVEGGVTDAALRRGYTTSSPMSEPADPVLYPW